MDEKKQADIPAPQAEGRGVIHKKDGRKVEFWIGRPPQKEKEEKDAPRDHDP